MEKNRIRNLKRMIEDEKSSRNFYNLEILYNELGKSYRAVDKYLKSLKAFYKAKDFSEKIGSDLRSDIYLSIAEIFRVLGRKGVAEKYLEKSYELSLKGNKERQLVKIYNIYGDIAFEKKMFYEALTYYQMSVDLSAKNGLFPEMIETAYKVSMRLIRSGNRKLGMKILKDVIDNAIGKKYYNNLLPKIYLYVNQLILSGKVNAAYGYLKVSDDIFAPYYRKYFFMDYLLGKYQELKGNERKALTYYKRALYGLDRLFSGMSSKANYEHKDDIEEIYSGIARFFFKMFDSTNVVDYLKQAVYISEIKNSYIYEFHKVKGSNYRFIGGELKRIESEIKRLKKEMSLISGKENSLPAENRIKKELEHLNFQRMDVLEFLREAPQITKRLKFRDFKSLNIRSLLDDRSIILKFIDLEDQIYVIVIDKKSIGYKKIDIPAKKIFSEIRELIKPLTDFSEGKVDMLRVKYDMKLSKSIYNQLLSDILSFYKNKNNLYIIPDGILFNLPFEALVTGFKKVRINPDVYFSEYRRGKFLIEKYSLSYLFSLSHFKKKRCRLNKKYDISVFGSPLIDNTLYSELYLTGKDGYLGDIPSTLTEVNSIRSVFIDKKEKIFSQGDFTVKNFMRFAQKSKIIHIASHYVPNVNFPGYSSIVCSPGKTEGPLLYIYKIPNLKLDCSLVVLSACESAEGYLLGEQSLRGIAASFYKAGARSFLASFWPVDQFSSRIMPYFYRGLRNHRMNRSELWKILRRIKIDFMKKTVKVGKNLRISLGHPLIWANFVLYNFFL